ncbi:MAG: phenylalanine--tRNA ligase subunit beta [Parachlamydiaceae bacterium]
MRIPLNWLNEYIDTKMSPAEIAKTLTLAGLEVDSIDTTALPCTNVVVAKVLECHKHPEADNLTVASVFDGEQTFQVVCGAPNCRAGIKTALARVDGYLADETGKKFKIKKAKLRGVDSFGMLCAPDELGISKEGDGIIEFSQHLKEGTDVAELYASTVFEISLTPNLGHCSSLIGVARELSAAKEIPYRLPDVEMSEDVLSLASKFISVNVMDSEGCPRYACRVIHNVTVGPSPEWLTSRLEAAGMRSVNNVVDVTNYVMLELGHPLHAFDAEKIGGAALIVRKAADGDVFTTLDGKERLLTSGDLLICDQHKPIALAGIMGGLNSEVGSDTKNIVLEAASFAPGRIRRTSKRLGLMTDASKRFERGCDSNILPLVLDRAARLIQQVAGGEVSSGIVDTAPQGFPLKKVNCRLSRINQLLGTRLSAGEVENVFKRLEFSTRLEGLDLFHVQVPSYRNDIKEEVDLIEEVARIFGYDNITISTARFTSSSVPHQPVFIFEREMRSRLIGEGLQEFITCDLIGPSILDVIQETEMPESAWVRVLNPTSVEQSILRTSMLPGLLQVIKYNWDHQNQDVAGFEIGRIHFKDGDNYSEQSVAAIVLSGKSTPHYWGEKAQEADFFILKGIVENILNELQIPDISFKVGKIAALHSGRQAVIFSGSLAIGSLGEVHPAVLRRLDVPQKILFAEINLHHLLRLRSKDIKMQQLPIYPGSERDWTLTLKESTAIDDIFKAVYSVPSKHLENVSLLDIYRSDKLGAGLKNVTLRFLYRDREKTIAQEKVDAEHARIMQSVGTLI